MARKGYEKETQTVIGGKTGFWEKYAYDVFMRAEKKDDGRCEKVRVSEKDKHHWNIVAVGSRMETIKNELEKVNSEVEESKKILQTVANEIMATFEIIEPQLTGMIQRLRSARMACNQELRDALKSLSEVKEFFLEYDYEKEQAQVERFIKNAKELRKLIDDGTADAISTVVIKLAVKE